MAPRPRRLATPRDFTRRGTDRDHRLHGGHWPRPQLVRALHGTWADYIAAASRPGIVLPTTLQLTADDLLEAGDLWIRSFARAPTPADWYRPNLDLAGELERIWPPAAAVRRHFTTWPQYTQQLDHH
ncbi:hypothetical protein GKE82_24725 [Conexibacter sp. W3-3-2]|uniref:hypothetical protein n=1 Tax=Conexibacter sp. W3-3-2 TaxID=2675227 RepID=UPI0012B91CD6|nr:hypothetical protein [Conexibacter sp. W3-3-2]MTD47413.1 hypothetical protein [Conexibacter sp. W3-3-2]